MNIYHNPAAEQIYVNLLQGNYADFQVQIYNNIGQLVKTLSLDSTLPIGELTNGLYLLHIHNVKTLERFQQKLLIAK